MQEILRYDHADISYIDDCIVHDMSLVLSEGEILGIVGESGSGKSTVLRAAMGIGGAEVTGGDILFRGMSLIKLSDRERERINGRKLGMIFQDAGSSFCPVRTIGSQLREMLSVHGVASGRQAHSLAAKQLMELGLADADRILKSYPSELSGGMQQRVGVAAAMLLRPDVLLADEPTAALDEASQMQVVHQLLMIRERYGTAIVMVSHNMRNIAAVADHVMVMRQGRVVEYGAVGQILNHPCTEYTQRLLDAVPGFERV